MSDVTRILEAVCNDDPQAADQLLQYVYSQLRRLAARKLAMENPGQTLDATDLVHEAYRRLVDVEHQQAFQGRAHFFAAAAEAMRRVLVDRARRKKRPKHGGDRRRVELERIEVEAAGWTPERLLEINEAVRDLEEEDGTLANLFKLHYFAGFSIREVADLVGISRMNAQRQLKYAAARVKVHISD